MPHSIYPASDADLQVVRTGLAEHNSTIVGPENLIPTCFAARDEGGHVIGGIVAMTAWNWLFIESLWVSEAHRQCHLGSRLLETVEQEAIRRRCQGACLMTFSFQSPQFYLKHGFLVSGRVAEYPTGHELLILSKTLNLDVSQETLESTSATYRK